MLVRIALALLLALPASAAREGRQAIPGATGFGYRTLDGWPTTPTVCRVTTLDDSGAGSLRDCINADNRIVVFAVAGTIELSSGVLEFDNTRVAVFGQTAPGDGIQIMRHSTLDPANRNTVSVDGAHIVLQHLRVRNAIPPNGIDDVTDTCYQGDAVSVNDSAADILLDHLSLAWAGDEGINVGDSLITDGAVRVTVQNSLISEPLAVTDAGAASCTSTAKGFLEQGESVSVIRNVFAIAARRMVLIQGGGLHDIRNNLFHRAADLDIPGAILDCDSSSNRQTRINYKGNIWVKNSGVTTEESIWIEKQTTCVGEGCDGISIYSAGNVDWTVTDPDGSQDGLFHCREFTNGCHSTLAVGPDCASATYRTATQWTAFHRHYLDDLHVEDVDLEAWLLANVGAFPRDSVDTCALSNVAARTGSVITGTTGASQAQVTTGCGPADTLTGSACTDSDTDGMCDSWETEYWGDLDEIGTTDADGDGWLNIEEFAHDTHPLYNRRGGP